MTNNAVILTNNNSVLIKTYIAGLLIFFVCAIGLAQDPKIAKECIKKFNASPQDIQDFKFGIVSATDIPENVQCTVKCVLEQEGWVDTATREFTPAKLMVNFSELQEPEELESAVEKCMKYKIIETCEDAAHLMACLWEI